MNEQQNLRCARCGHNPLAKEPVVVPQYSETARHFLRPDDSEPIRSIDDESDEAAFLHEELQRGRDMLSSADEDIATLQAMLVNLRAKRDSLKKFVDDHAAILSRVCLPPELWVKIFHLAYPVVDNNVKNGIWRFGRVCSYWRSVLMSSPSLWSTINPDRRSLVPVTKEILSLSGNSPLRITLFPSFNDNKERSVLFRTILAASHRWYAITFDISHSLHPLLNQLKGRIPMLTEVMCSNGTSLDWLEGAPSLQKLKFYFAHVPSSIPALPWSQLREFHCAELNLDQEYEILRQCVNLETYTLATRTLTGPVPSDLCMSKLRTLTVFASLGPGTPWMGNLTVPSLDEVTIESAIHLTEPVVLSFSNLLSRSHCFPTKLEIKKSFEDSVVMLRLFSQFSFQNLTTLHISCNHDLQHISILTLHPETENSVILLPRLENLHLRPYSVHLDDLTLVIDMVRSRWHLHERVKVVSHLSFFAFLPDFYKRPQLRGTLIPLLAFRDEGLKMDIDGFYL